MAGRGRGTWDRGRVLDLVFLIGIALKALDGLGELLVGLPLLVLPPAQLSGLAHRATAGELREDPHDLIATMVLHGVTSLSADATLLAAVYLVVHGAVKVLIVVALLRGTRRVYPWAIAALGAFLVWQGAEMVLHPSIGLALLSAFDVVVIVLTWREWRQHRSLLDSLLNAFPWLERLREGRQRVVGCMEARGRAMRRRRRTSVGARRGSR